AADRLVLLLQTVGFRLDLLAQRLQLLAALAGVAVDLVEVAAHLLADVRQPLQGGAGPQLQFRQLLLECHGLALDRVEVGAGPPRPRPRTGPPARPAPFAGPPVPRSGGAVVPARSPAPARPGTAATRAREDCPVRPPGACAIRRIARYGPGAGWSPRPAGRWP